MSKPSWDDSPSWARYLAMDANGTWHWYEEEPIKCQYENEWLTYGDYIQASSIIKDGWKDSLEKRP